MAFSQPLNQSVGVGGMEMVFGTQNWNNWRHVCIFAAFAPELIIVKLI